MNPNCLVCNEEYSDIRGAFEKYLDINICRQCWAKKFSSLAYGIEYYAVMSYLEDVQLLQLLLNGDRQDWTEAARIELKKRQA